MRQHSMPLSFPQDSSTSSHASREQSTSPRRSLSLAAALLIFLAALSSCAGKCYLEDGRYLNMKKTFTDSGSLQAVEQRMNDEGWSRCEKSELLYRLRKDLDLESLPESANPTPEFVE